MPQVRGHGWRGELFLRFSWPRDGRLARVDIAREGHRAEARWDMGRANRMLSVPRPDHSANRSLIHLSSATLSAGNMDSPGTTFNKS